MQNDPPPQLPPQTFLDQKRKLKIDYDYTDQSLIERCGEQRLTHTRLSCCGEHKNDKSQNVLFREMLIHGPIRIRSSAAILDCVNLYQLEMLIKTLRLWEKLAHERHEWNIPALGGQIRRVGSRGLNPFLKVRDQTAIWWDNHCSAWNRQDTKKDQSMHSLLLLLHFSFFNLAVYIKINS